MVIGKGDSLEKANERAKEAIKKIDCPSLFYRTDIGKAVINK